MSTQIDDKVLAKRIQDSFDAGFAAGIGWAVDPDNASLIAAAPELLAALKEIVSILDSSSISDLYAKRMHKDPRANSIRAIIGKAEGK